MIKLITRFARALCMRSSPPAHDDLPIDPSWMPLDLATQGTSGVR